MVSRREVAAPHAHHLALVENVVEDIARNLDRLGRMRALTVVRVGASGAYRISAVPAADVRLGFLDGFGIALTESIGLIDEVLAYDPGREAAVMVVETNPLDGALITFLVQSLEARS